MRQAFQRGAGELVRRFAVRIALVLTVDFLVNARAVPRLLATGACLPL
jgi:hypothetical protein